MKYLITLILLSGCMSDLSVNMPPDKIYRVRYEVTGPASADILIESLTGTIQYLDEPLPFVHEFETVNYCKFVYVSGSGGGEIVAKIYVNDVISEFTRSDGLAVCSDIVDEWDCYKTY